MSLQNGDLILFQGDSITDCGRNREDASDLGPGYPKMVAAAISVLYPEKKLRYINLGISGHRTHNLLERWENDCIELRPAFLSILVGINDLWHRKTNEGNTDEDLEMYYDKLLTRTREALGDIPILMMEPFLTPDNETTITFQELERLKAIVRRLAEKHHAIFVPLDDALRKASDAFPPHSLTREGVHPTAQGHSIIAKHWLDAALPIIF